MQGVTSIMYIWKEFNKWQWQIYGAQCEKTKNLEFLEPPSPVPKIDFSKIFCTFLFMQTLMHHCNVMEKYVQVKRKLKNVKGGMATLQLEFYLALKRSEVKAKICKSYGRCNQGYEAWCPVIYILFFQI